MSKLHGRVSRRMWRHVFPGEGEELDPNPGFGRYTPRARNAVTTAHNEARAASSGARKS